METAVGLPQPQVQKNLVQLVHPQIPFVLCVGTQPVSAQAHTDIYYTFTLTRPHLWGGHSLGDTQGVLTLGDQRLLVVLPLRSDCNQLQGVGSSTELSVHWSHLLTGAVGQVDASDWVLTPRRENTM